LRADTKVSIRGSWVPQGQKETQGNTGGMYSESIARKIYNTTLMSHTQQLGVETQWSISIVS